MWYWRRNDHGVNAGGRDECVDPMEDTLLILSGESLSCASIRVEEVAPRARAQARVQEVRPGGALMLNIAGFVKAPSSEEDSRGT